VDACICVGQQDVEKLKKLIVTADDFGAAVPMNEAVEQGHRSGVLSAASLMVGAPAVRDAVERARRLPSLGVGLHLTLVNGYPVLPPRQIPDLVGPDGRFSRHVVRFGIALFFVPKIQRQVEAEIEAQFQRFRLTGLPLDHVNGHQHFTCTLWSRAPFRGLHRASAHPRCGFRSSRSGTPGERRPTGLCSGL
jgi:hopanoid biosynthesis associated protein HpnK